MMKPRSALFAAILCGVAAVALVALDLAFNVDTKLEVRDANGAWRTVASTSTDPQRAYPASVACGSHFRLTVHNGLLWGTSLHVTITASGNSGTTTLLDETWSVGAGADVLSEFNAPNSTFESPNPAGAPTKSPGSIQVSFGPGYTNQLYATACKEATA